MKECSFNKVAGYKNVTQKEGRNNIHTSYKITQKEYSFNKVAGYKNVTHKEGRNNIPAGYKITLERKLTQQSLRVTKM